MTALKIHNKVLCIYILKFCFGINLLHARHLAPIETPTNLLAIGELLTVANKKHIFSQSASSKMMPKGRWN